ncbi:substrate-binding domain-containing protein [Seonamhaeicola aphaedonensis]|uniref:ABC-type nitrate/sulfonate/bicarbonate transport system substrate-binding protein n=1 Tax=Seonamhaeicola aphaedonensis TaxID=1461338 RepID=A0A3D9HIL2_9FLAO|nr:substrate-binding domain-containing protein [Seonamhaeicola aphaedonensis]RED49349.1 ABC-type nitrate/sulfonate/bicarbonate transport system substrate-binding protein [Seonamhaeicola aphaedonensis]
MKQVNIGGVPEHFNLAWYLTLKNGEYKDKDIDLRWHDYYGGTGAMCKALRNKDIDIAVILTEGIIKDIIAGNPSKIVQTFVQSPLIWGIHVAANSNYNTIEDIKGTKAAISRYGSGSHLMAYINAENNNWNLEKDLDFEVIKNLEGAVAGLTKGIADYFLWEKFTTKPLVDDGTFRSIGNCPSPWPCFVIAVREDFIENEKETLRTILNIINNTTIDFKHIPSIDKTIANRYEQQLEDVQEWLSLTEWSQDIIDEDTILKVQKELLNLNIIPEIVDYDQLVYKL